MAIRLLLSLLALLITGTTVLATQGEGPFINTFVAQMPADSLDSSHECLGNILGKYSAWQMERLTNGVLS